MTNCAEVSVIHGFEFPTYCNVLEISPDHETVISAGAYKPCIRVFDLKDHTEKFERNTDEEIIRISAIEDNWKKLALLHRTGRIEFHSQYGKYHIVDIPRECRDMKMDAVKGEILTAGKGKEIYRFSVVEGKFLPSIYLSIPGAESICTSKTHSLYGVAGENGVCEFIDARTSEKVKLIDSKGSAATACCFSSDGIFFSVGTSEGIVSLYDLRSTDPVITKDHMYDFPITKVQIQKSSITSADKKSIKIWDRKSAKTLCTIEPEFQIYDFATSEGIVIVGGDAPQIKTFYAPALGSFPKWCNYLEGTTEEMIEIKKEVYFGHYKFLTEDQVSALNFQTEIGRSIKPHMHGYLVPLSLYEQKVPQSK